MAENRTFTVIFNLVDNFSSRFDAIQRKISTITSTPCMVSIDIDSSQMGLALDEVRKTANNTASDISKGMGAAGERSRTALDKIGEGAERFSSKALSAFERATQGINRFHEALRTSIGSLMELAVGGGVAGFAWLDVERTDLLSEQTYRAIEANRKLRLSYQEIQGFITQFKGSGWTTTGEMVQTLQTASLYGTKYGYRNRRLEEITTAAATVAFAKQESLGGMSGSDLVKIAAAIPGKLRAENEMQFRIATADIAQMAGYEALIKTARGRLKLLQREAEHGGEGGGPINIRAELDRRPWAEAMKNIEDLKHSIGDSISGPMRTLTKLFADLAKAIDAIPGGSAFIGWTAILIGAAGAAGLLWNAISPVVSVLNAAREAMMTQIMASRMMAISNAAVAASYGTIVVGEEAATVASTGVIASAYGMATALWSALAPILLIVAPLLILAGVLYLVETKTHIFSRALKELGRTQMAKDLLDWFRDVGYMVREAIRWIDSLYRKLKTTGLLSILGGVLSGMALGPMGALLGAGASTSPADLLSTISDGISRLLSWVLYIFDPLSEAIHDILRRVWGFFEWLGGLWERGIKYISELPEKLQDVILTALSHLPGLEHLRQYTTEGKKQAAEAASYGVVGWGSGENEGMIGLQGYDSANITDQKLIAQIREAKVSVQKEPGPLKGAAWKEFQERYPELVRYMVPINVMYYRPEGAINTLGVPKDILPPRPMTATSIWDTLTKPPVTPEVADANDWISNKIYHNPTKNTVNPYPPLSYDMLEDDKIYQNLGGGMPQSGAALKKYHFDLTRWYDPTAKPLTEHAVGATFQRGGFFAGIVHKDEEIIPQATAQRGPGPISRALEALEGVTIRPGVPGPGSYSYTINVTNQNDFSGLKVSGGVDVAKLLDRIDKIIETKSVEAVKKAIGQRRT